MSDNPLISEVPVGLVPFMWPEIFDMLDRSVSRSNGEATMQSVYRRLLNSECALFLITEADQITMVFTLETITFESGKKALWMPFIAGDNMHKYNSMTQEFLQKVGLNLGCEEIRGTSVRDGWQKVLEPFGWEPVHHVLKCKVRSPL